MNGLVKKVFRKSIGRRLLTLIQLQTFVRDAVAVVNSRPLVYVGDDVSSTTALTPSYFLTLNPSTGIPESDVDEKDNDFIAHYNSSDSLLNMWKKGQKLLNLFWIIWRNDYLLSLRERTQTKLTTGRVLSSNKPYVAEIVLLKRKLETRQNSAFNSNS